MLSGIAANGSWKGPGSAAHISCPCARGRASRFRPGTRHQNQRSLMMMVSPGRTRVAAAPGRGCAAHRPRRPIDLDVVAIGARREAAGDRHRGLDRHVGHIRILPRLSHLAEDKEWAIGLDLDRHMRLADESAAQLVRDSARELLRGAAARIDSTDQRHRHLACGIDEIGIAQAVLPEHHDAQLVAGIERIGGLRRLQPRKDRPPLGGSRRLATRPG